MTHSGYIPGLSLAYRGISSAALIGSVKIITRLNQSEQLMKFKIWVAQFLDSRDRRTAMFTDKQIAKQLNFSRIFLFFTTLTSAK